MSQVSSAEATITLAKVVGSEDRVSCMSDQQMEEMVTAVFIALTCALDGAKIPDSSYHPTIQSAAVSVTSKHHHHELHITS